MAKRKPSRPHQRRRNVLTEKQAAFAREYLIDLNGTQAAIRAGFSKPSAGRQAVDLLQKPHVRAAIQAAMDARANRTEITAERVLQEIARLAFCDPRAFYDEDGTVVPVPKLSADAAACIVGFDVEEVQVGEKPLVRTKKLRLASKVAALELAARHLKLLTDRSETRAVDKDGNDAPLPAVIIVPAAYQSVEEYDAAHGGTG